MLSNPSQYSPQSLLPPFFGQQAGLPQMSAGLFGQPGAYNGHAQYANGQSGIESVLLHQVAPVLGQLAQHIAIQSAVTQQIGVAVHQLAHQLALQGLQGFPGGGFGAGQAFAGASQPYIGGAQPYGQLGLGAGAYGGFNPQAQGWGQQAQAWGPQGQGWGPQGQPWGANRPQTIQ
jgi:hypothetical protein